MTGLGGDKSGISPFELLGEYVKAAANATALSAEKIAGSPHYVMFAVGSDNFLIDVREVESVIQDEPVLKPLPFSPGWFKGLSSVRSEIVSVVSFSAVWNEKTGGSTSKKKQYILLKGVVKGFMLEVDRLGGIRSIEVRDKEVQNKFIDGESVIDGQTWLRINTGALLESVIAHDKMDF